MHVCSVERLFISGQIAEINRLDELTIIVNRYLATVCFHVIRDGRCSVTCAFVFPHFRAQLIHIIIIIILLSDK